MAEKIHVKGIVQGVGFRPFVYRLAHELGLLGWVCNASDGVHILVQGEGGLLNEFCSRLKSEKPPAARISSIARAVVADYPAIEGFSIQPSDAESGKRTLVSPDLATCPDCLNELFDAQDRRYRYPFINCTNCGPRFTIIEGLPYDRPLTTMSSFTMCPSCSAEYQDPSNRRFHAQPDACFECGPHLELIIPSKASCKQSDESIARAAELLLGGAVLAAKGLGGYHLVCDAANEQAVSLLRQRKHRPSKPLAVMYSDLQTVQESFAVSNAEALLLTCPA
ncbi:MAG: acylphosphatase, partial [Coriobacteriales bacterium]|nr:acylphosphatase [Coriobacteriales bacterium]